MKKIISLLIIGALMFGIFGIFTACKPKEREADGFVYIVLDEGEGKFAAIIRLVDEEKEIDELIIPEKLGKYPVKRIGAFKENKLDSR